MLRTSSLLILVCLFPRALPAQTADNVLLLVNENSEDSKSVARVVVSLLIDEMGQLMKSEIKSGPKELAQAVLKAVQQWRFEPQLVNGRPEVSRLSLTFNSKLRDTP